MMADSKIVLSDVTRALHEDVGSGDISAALLPPNLLVEANIISREPMLFCGRPWAEASFLAINPAIELDWRVADGDWLPVPSSLCHIKGFAKDVLTAERCALNFLQTLSGTATKTREYVLQLVGTDARLLDTRKTIPGLRHAQKYAVLCGGGNNHRMGLYDAFLIKENHIRACGSLTKAIHQARKTHARVLLEVEVETIAELHEALAAKPDRILLDNFTLEGLREAVACNQPPICELEASGGIHLSTIRGVAETGVDYISAGDITKSVQAIDLSLLIQTGMTS